MRTGVVLEIARGPGNLIPSSLIVNAYQQSRDFQFYLILDSISPLEINKILDPIVPRFPLNIPGVIYLSLKDEMKIQKIINTVDEIWVSSAKTRQKLLSLGAQEGIIHYLGSGKNLNVA